MTLVNLMTIIKNMCLADVIAQPGMTTISSDKRICMLSSTTLLGFVLTEK